MYKADLGLVTRASKGDQEAFETLYRKTDKAIRAQVYKICPFELEDLTQATWAKIYEKLGSYKGNAAFTTWAVTVARNVVLMRLRYKRNRPELQWHEAFGANVKGDELEAEPGTEDIRFKAIPLRPAIRNAIASLAPRQRSVIVLRMVQAYSVTEVSTMLGISPEAVKAAHHHGVEHLRTALQGI